MTNKQPNHLLAAVVSEVKMSNKGWLGASSTWPPGGRSSLARITKRSRGGSAAAASSHSQPACLSRSWHGGRQSDHSCSDRLPRDPV